MNEPVEPDLGGPLSGANALGEAGSLDSGPGVRIALRVDLDGVIRAAGFELVAFEDAQSIAAAVCAAVVDSDVEAVNRTTVRAISSLAGRDMIDVAARTVHAALRGALRPWLLPTAQRGGEIVCACFALERDAIVETIQTQGLETIDDVRDCLPATRGCGTCRPDIEALLRRERAE